MVHGPGPEEGSMNPWSIFCPPKSIENSNPMIILNFVQAGHSLKNAIY